MKPTFKLTPTQLKKIQKIGKKHQLDFVVLHGSRATGKIVSPDPDYDLAVYRRGGILFDEHITLVNQFMGVFGNDTDVKTLHKKDPLFRFEVMRDAILLYGDEEKFNQFFLYAYKDFQESQPLYRNLKIIQKKRQNLFNQLYAERKIHS